MRPCVVKSRECRIVIVRRLLQLQRLRKLPDERIRRPAGTVIDRLRLIEGGLGRVELRLERRDVVRGQERACGSSGRDPATG